MAKPKTTDEPRPAHRPPRGGVASTAKVEVRCTEDERDAWRAAAEGADVSVSEWIRGLANRAAAKRG